MTALSLTFQNTHFDVIDRLGNPWLKQSELASALYGFSKGGGQSDPPLKYAEKSLKRLYQRNSAEFTDSMTALVELDTPGGRQQVRIFSLRGCHLLAMFARTPVAAAFRRWVLDILDRQAEPAWPVIEGGGLPHGLRILLKHDGGGRFSARVLDQPRRYPVKKPAPSLLPSQGLLPPLLDAWAARFPSLGRRGDAITTGEALKAIQSDPENPLNAALTAALSPICEDAFGLNAWKLGRFLSQAEKQTTEGLRFESVGLKRNARLWRVVN